VRGRRHAPGFRSRANAPLRLLSEGSRRAEHSGDGALVFAWWLSSDVAAPLLGAVDVRPLWESVIASVVFYGVVLSEVTTLVRRRAAPAP